VKKIKPKLRQTKNLKHYFKILYHHSALIRRFILINLDVFIIIFSTLLTFWISRTNYNHYSLKDNYWILRCLIIFSIPLYTITGQYQSLLKSFDINSIYSVIFRNIILISLSALYGKIFSFELPYLSNFVILWSLISIQSILLRLILKEVILSISYNPLKPITHVAIYGAGIFGSQLANTLRISGNYKVINFIDDDSKLWSRKLNGISILPPKSIKYINPKPEQILLALPESNRKDIKKIFENLEKYKIPILQVPSIEDLRDGKAKIEQLRPILIEDLLGRDTVKPNLKLLGGGIKNKVICITGAGGSIGSELCRQISDLEPLKIILLERNEPSLYSIYEEMKKEKAEKGFLLEALLVSAGDYEFNIEIFKKHKVNVIFHAAAYKHVPIVEENPIAGIKNNSLVTFNLCKAASISEVEKFILISTDKAVRPTNVMGATKRLAEMIVQAFASNNYSNTCFSMVRFGNVLNSSGSVVPLFREQIRNGGPITITHPEIIRYFMTIKEAAQLVIQAANLSEGGDLFLLDMGEPVLIKNLAKRMIKLSGLSLKSKNENPDGDIEIIYTGLRPGEKLYEELLINAESIPTENPLIFRAKENFIEYELLLKEIELLKEKITEKDTNACIKILKKLVPEWKTKKVF